MKSFLMQRPSVSMILAGGRLSREMSPNRAGNSRAGAFRARLMAGGGGPARFQAWQEHAAARRYGTAARDERAAAALSTRAIARRRGQMGPSVHRTLCGGVSRARRLSLWVCAVDGQRARALRRPRPGSALSSDRRQHIAVCRGRREPEDVPGTGVVGLLSAAAAVDQSSARNLCLALGLGGGADLPFVSLDADRRARARRWFAPGAVRCRGTGLVQRPLARPRLRHRRLSP